MSEPNYDAMLWAAADRYMSEGTYPEGEVTFTVERDVDALPEVLRRHMPADAECVELEVECEAGDEDAVVVGVVQYVGKGHRIVKTPHIVIPLTEAETKWTYEAAIEAAELRRDAYEADAYDRRGDR
jgi:hypothetical protein